MRIVPALFLMCAFASAAEPAMTFHVAPDGNDAWSGKLPAPKADKADGPFATVSRALTAVRDQRALQPGAKAPLLIQVRGGTYALTTAIVLLPEHSGTADSPTIIQAAPGQNVLLSGGTQLTGFKLNAQGRWELLIPEVQRGEWVFNQLWVNGERRYRPRMPKKGYYTIASEIAPSKPDAKGFDRMVFSGTDIDAAWKNLDDVEVLTFHHWFMSRLRVASIDAQKHTVNFTGTTFNKEAWSALTKGWRYLVENVGDALSEPGEWYLNRKSGLLTYIPLPGEKPDSALVFAPRLESLLQFKGDLAKKKHVQHIHLKGLTFSHTHWKLANEGYSFCQAEGIIGGAVNAVGARQCVIEKCAISQVGHYALELAGGCKNNRVENCLLIDLGAGGVKIGETGLRGDEEMASHNVIRNNVISRGGRMHPAGIGVWIGHSPHNSVDHNEISDFYYTGISLGWSWGYGNSGTHHNTISHNHIHKIGQGVLSDMGGIYTLGVSPGTVLSHNVIHDVDSFSYGGWGIYFDEGTTDMLAENNISYRTKSSGFHQHYGKNNRVINNIFAFGREAQLMRTRAETHLSFTAERNIVLLDGAPLLGSNWSGTTANYLLNKNLYWDVSGGELEFDYKSFKEWQKSGQDKESIIADPLFADPAKGDFTLKPGSPAEKTGFKPIDVSTVGSTLKPELAAVPAAYPVNLFEVKAPQRIDENFESTAVDDKAQGAETFEEKPDASIRVSDEAAASGKRSLKFKDAEGQKQSFSPFVNYEPRFKEGVIEGAFSLRMEKGAVFFHEWRTAGEPYHAGPSLWVQADGAVQVNGKTLLTLPPGQWSTFRIVCALGKKSTAKWELEVTLPGAAESKKFSNLDCSAKFKSLFWFGFVSNATAATTFFVDDISLKAP